MTMEEKAGSPERQTLQKTASERGQGPDSHRHPEPSESEPQQKKEDDVHEDDHHPNPTSDPSLVNPDLRIDSSFPTSLSELTFIHHNVVDDDNDINGGGHVSGSDVTNINNKNSIYETLSSLRKSTLSIPNRLRSILIDAEFVVSLTKREEFAGYPLIANERCGSWYIPIEYRTDWLRRDRDNEDEGDRDEQCMMNGNDSGGTDNTSSSAAAAAAAATSLSSPPSSENMTRNVTRHSKKINDSTSAYFKSTDGHHGQWSLSLRRLNLQVLDVLGRNSGAILVDSTRRGKSLPDALRRTVPIWVSVWNRVLFGNEGDEDNDSEKARLNSDKDNKSNRLRRRRFRHGGFQNCGLDEHEVWQIEQRMDAWVEGLKALDLDFDDIKRRVRRPIRCLWTVHHGDTYLPDGWTEEEDESFHSEQEDGTEAQNQWNTLVLCSASKRVLGAEMSADGYIQGAGDDSEGWSQGLTPQLFWENKDKLLSTSEDKLPGFIQDLVGLQKDVGRIQDVTLILPTNNLFIGKGNISTVERGPAPFTLSISCNGTSFRDEKQLLVLGCRSRKLGSRDLREKLAIAKLRTAQAYCYSDDNSHVLVLDETGKDLSTGVALMLLCLFYDDKGKLHRQSLSEPVDKQFIRRRLAWITAAKPDANPSRSTLQAVNSFLMEKPL